MSRFLLNSPTRHPAAIPCRAKATLASWRGLVKVFDALGGIFESNQLSPTRLFVMGRSLGNAAAIEVALHAGELLAGLMSQSPNQRRFARLLLSE